MKAKNIPPVAKIKMIKINLQTVAYVFIALILLFYVISFFNKGNEGNEISVSQFVTNLKTNKYASLDIRDDGKAVALSKGYYIAKKDSNTEFTAKTGLKIVNADEYQEISLDELYNLIKPLGFQDTIKLMTQPQLFPRTPELYIADDYILARSTTLSSKDFIVKKAGKTEYDRLISSKGITNNDLSVKITYASIQASDLESGDFVANYQGNKFDYIWTVGDYVIGKIKADYIVKEYIYWSPNNENVTSFSELLQREGVYLDSNLITQNFVRTVQIPWGDILTTVFFGALIFVSFIMFRGIQGNGSSLMKFGQSKARMFFGKKPDVTFKDVAGVDEAKEELNEIVMFLKEPKKFLDVGARIPKGVLMVGAPGTGKTLLARAIAGEAGVPFFHTSGSEFEEMLVGAGASRVRDLFDKAKKAAPALIFIDEIDAVARKRGTSMNSGTTEQTLNQILVEMDGFEKTTNIIVIAATNRPDVLDPAILRPGRFDRRVMLDLPDLEGRKQIINLHAKNKPIAKSVNIEVIAKRTVGFSGADIENMLNEAAIIIAKAGRKEIVSEDLEEAATKVQIGPAKLSRKRNDKELKRTAYHEVGHALVMKMVPDHDPVHRVTIVSRGMALGYTMPLPDKDKVSMTKTEMLSDIKALLAGFATEELVFNDVTSGASNDIEKASSIARKMVKSFGMSKKLGLVKYGQEEDHQFLGYSYQDNKGYSEDTAKSIDEEVRIIIATSFEETKRIILKYRELMDKIVDVLLEKETIDAEEFNAFFEGMKTGSENE
jgi:cell division protease FtsH